MSFLHAPASNVGIGKTEHNKPYQNSRWIHGDKKFIRRQLANDLHGDEIMARTKRMEETGVAEEGGEEVKKKQACVGENISQDGAPYRGTPAWLAHALCKSKNEASFVWWHCVLFFFLFPSLHFFLLASFLAVWYHSPHTAGTSRFQVKALAFSHWSLAMQGHATMGSLQCFAPAKRASAKG